MGVAEKEQRPCEVSVGKKTVSPKFCVINGEGVPFLGRDIAMCLRALKIGVNISAVNIDLKNIGEILQEKYLEVFISIGKLKDPNVRPVEDPFQPEIKDGKKVSRPHRIRHQKHKGHTMG